MGIIDIHSHILFGLDDGSKSLEESLAMIRADCSQGVDGIIATPHFSQHYNRYSCEKARERLELLAKEIGDECRLYLGQEIFYSEYTLEALKRGELMGMAGSRYVLVEFYPWESFYNIQYAIRELCLQSYRPIIAHVERFEALRDESRIRELTGQGAYIQMNFDSLEGGFFNKDAAWCKGVLEDGLVHFLGSDMHNRGSRAPKLTKAVKWIDRHLDEDYARALLFGNALKMIEDKRI